MAKIKIHKSKIHNDDLDLYRFEDGDVLVAHVKDCTIHENIKKWFFAYREQDDPKKIGAHIFYNVDDNYFNYDSAYDVINKKWNPSNTMYFDKNEITELRFATDEERSEFRFILTYKYNCSLTETRKEIILKYINMIYGKN